jgi:hypothetical protein
MDGLVDEVTGAGTGAREDGVVDQEGGRWMITFLELIEPVSLTSRMRMPAKPTMVKMELLPGPTAVLKSGMVRGCPMIEMRSSFNAALRPVSPVRGSVPSDPSFSSPPK